MASAADLSVRTGRCGLVDAPRTAACEGPCLALPSQTPRSSRTGAFAFARTPDTRLPRQEPARACSGERHAATPRSAIAPRTVSSAILILNTRPLRSPRALSVYLPRLPFLVATCRSMSMTFFDRLRVWFVSLRFLVPAFFTFAAAALLQNPAVVPLLLIGAALTMAGVSHASGLVPEPGFARVLARRAVPFFMALVIYAAVVALL